MVLVVVLGFIFRPRRDTFYLRTTLVFSETDCRIAVEHDRIAVRIEVARLWLLFLPTFAAVAFLVVTSAKGTTWKFNLLDRFWEISSYPVFIGIRGFLFLVVGLLSTWVSERGGYETPRRAVPILCQRRQVDICIASEIDRENTTVAKLSHLRWSARQNWQGSYCTDAAIRK
jgi:hypothetical protein